MIAYSSCKTRQEQKHQKMNCDVSAFGVLNCFGLIYSIVIIIDSSNSLVLGHSTCEDPYPIYELARGIWTLVMSLVGLVIAKWHSKILQGIYLSLICLFLVGTLCLTGLLAFGTTNGEAGKENSKTFNLQSYSSWLKTHVVNDEQMVIFRKCMDHRNMCRKHLYTVDRWEHPIKVGCCKPPPTCGYLKTNRTVWTMPIGGIASDDPDCLRWDLIGRGYCLECDSCKAGSLAVVLRHWYYRDFICFVYLILLLSCYAFSFHSYDH